LEWPEPQMGYGSRESATFKQADPDKRSAPVVRRRVLSVDATLAALSIRRLYGATKKRRLRDRPNHAVESIGMRLDGCSLIMAHPVAGRRVRNPVCTAHHRRVVVTGFAGHISAAQLCGNALAPECRGRTVICGACGRGSRSQEAMHIACGD
jgi:hypothetical protein